MFFDTYSTRDNAARCAKCGGFMPWSRSMVLEADPGVPVPCAPALVERGVCSRCDGKEQNKTETKT